MRKWLDGVEAFVSEHGFIPVGDVEQLDKLLDASNVSTTLKALIGNSDVFGLPGVHSDSKISIFFNKTKCNSFINSV